MLSSGELSELFDVLGPWRRAACWLLRDRPVDHEDDRQLALPGAAAL